MSVLKNTASVHQKLWALNTASDYMEGLLININRFLFSQGIIAENCPEPIYHINRRDMDIERQNKYGQSN